MEQTLKVLADPRDKARRRYVLRHDFLAALYDELGAVDAMLNHIDARLKRANAAQAAALRAFPAKLTYNPRNVEDLGGPPGLRDRLLDWRTARQLVSGADGRSDGRGGGLHALFERFRRNTPS